MLIEKIIKFHFDILLTIVLETKITRELLLFRSEDR